MVREWDARGDGFNVSAVFPFELTSDFVSIVTAFDVELFDFVSLHCRASGCEHMFSTEPNF